MEEENAILSDNEMEHESTHNNNNDSSNNCDYNSCSLKRVRRSRSNSNPDLEIHSDNENINSIKKSRSFLELNSNNSLKFDQLMKIAEESHFFVQEIKLKLFKCGLGESECISLLQVLFSLESDLGKVCETIIQQVNKTNSVTIQELASKVSKAQAKCQNIKLKLNFNSNQSPKNYFCKFHPHAYNHNTVNCRYGEKFNKLNQKRNFHGSKAFKSKPRF